MDPAEEAAIVETDIMREWRARLLDSVIKTLIGLCLLYEAIAFLPGFSDYPLLGALIFGGLLAVLVILVLTGSVGVVGYGGLLSSIWMVFTLLLLLAGMLGGLRSVLIYCGLCCLVALGLLVNHWTASSACRSTRSRRSPPRWWCCSVW